MSTEGLRFSVLHSNKLKSRGLLDVDIWDFAAQYHSSPTPAYQANTEVHVALKAETFEMPLIPWTRESVLLVDFWQIVRLEKQPQIKSVSFAEFVWHNYANQRQDSASLLLHLFFRLLFVYFNTFVSCRWQ